MSFTMLKCRRCRRKLAVGEVRRLREAGACVPFTCRRCQPVLPTPCGICGKPTDYVVGPDDPQPTHPECRASQETK